MLNYQICLLSWFYWLNFSAVSAGQPAGHLIHAGCLAVGAAVEASPPAAAAAAAAPEAKLEKERGDKIPARFTGAK